MRYEQWKDADLIAELTALDVTMAENDTRMNDWEVAFTSEMIGKNWLSPRQKECVIKIIRKY